MTAIDSGFKSTATTLIAAGTTGSSRTCLDWAIDGFLVTGHPFVYAFVGDFAVTSTKPAAGFSVDIITYFTGTTPGGQAANSYFNMGGITTL